MEELKEELIKVAHRALTNTYIEGEVPSKELLDTINLIAFLEQISRSSSKGSTH